MVNIYKNIISIITIFVFGVFTNFAFASKDDMSRIIYGRDLAKGGLKKCLESPWSSIYKGAMIYEITDPDIFDKVVSVDGTVKEHQYDDPSVKCLIGKPNSFDYNKNYIRASIDHSSIPSICKDGTHTGIYAYNKHGISFGVGPSGPRGDGENTQYWCKKWRLFVVHNMNVGHYHCGLYTRSLDTFTDLVLSCDETMKIAPFEHGDNDYGWIQDIKNKYDKHNLIEIGHHKYNVYFEYFKCDNGEIAAKDNGLKYSDYDRYKFKENLEYIKSCGSEEFVAKEDTVGWQCEYIECDRGAECSHYDYGRKWVHYGGNRYFCVVPQLKIRAKGSEVIVRKERDIYSIKLKLPRLRHKSDVSKAISVTKIYDPNVVYE